jgi:glycosyltransferase involved in cell wall biosynthesis
MTSAASQDLTIVTACRNREDNLRRAILSWLALDPREIIICDWGSATKLTCENLEVGDYAEKVNIIRREAESWVLTWAFNEALAQVRTAYTLKLDCDHVVSCNFLELNQPQFGQFARGHWRHADEGQQYINGAVMSCTDLLKQVGYYDERITTYGWDDSDLYARLYDASLGSSVLAKGSISHLEQCELTRTKEQIVTREASLAKYLGMEKTAFLITRNRILCGMLWPWSCNSFANREAIRFRFSRPMPEEESLIEYATLKAFDLHYKSKGLHKTGTMATEAYLETLYASELDSSSRPCSLCIADMLRRYSEACRSNDAIEKNLIRLALLSNSQEARIKSRMRALDQTEKLYSSPLRHKGSVKAAMGEKIPSLLIKNRKLFIDAQHGLGNRLRAIGSAGAIADATGRELVIIWQPDDHCNCRFSDLFDYQGAVLDASFVKEASDCEVHNYMTVEGGAKGELILSESDRDIYARSAFVLNSPHSSWEAENRFIQALRPVEAVLALVNSVRHPNDVSVHVRMEGGRKDEDLPYESSANWTEKDHDLIDHWRTKSHFTHFMKRIDALISEAAADHIFIAADQPETYEEFNRAYQGRLAWLKRRVYDRSAEQLQYALADAILLSRAPLLLGSTWSSFSELANRLSTRAMRVEMSGKDF